MKQLISTIVIVMMAVMANAQDFSYLSEIELNSADQVNDAKEDVLECCYYLVAARYNKKDVQRTLATDFVSKWMRLKLDEAELLSDQVNEITEGRDDLNELYLVYYAMNLIENEGRLQPDELQEVAFEGVIEFCENPINKIKLTKELKNLKSVIEDGKLSAYLSQY